MIVTCCWFQMVMGRVGLQYVCDLVVLVDFMVARSGGYPRMESRGPEGTLARSARSGGYPRAESRGLEGTLARSRAVWRVSLRGVARSGGYPRAEPRGLEGTLATLCFALLFHSYSSFRSPAAWTGRPQGPFL